MGKSPIFRLVPQPRAPSSHHTVLFPALPVHTPFPCTLQPLSTPLTPPRRFVAMKTPVRPRFPIIGPASPPIPSTMSLRVLREVLRPIPSTMPLRPLSTAATPPNPSTNDAPATTVDSTPPHPEYDVLATTFFSTFCGPPPARRPNQEPASSRRDDLKTAPLHHDQQDYTVNRSSPSGILFVTWDIPLVLPERTTRYRAPYPPPPPPPLRLLLWRLPGLFSI